MMDCVCPGVTVKLFADDAKLYSAAHRCSRLTRQHSGEQSGLVTLTFDLLTGYPSHV